MKRPTRRYIGALALVLLAATPRPAWGQAMAPALILDPAALDVAQASNTLFTFDLLVAGAQIAAQQDAAQSRQLAHNGLTVAERPAGMSAADARILWRAVHALARDDERGTLALLVQSDVVTTEAHALLLQMLGPAPTFAPHAPPAGLGPRQLAWAQMAPRLSPLMRHAWRDAQVPALRARLAPALRAVVPAEAELDGYTALLDKTFDHAATPAEQVKVLVVPLMAKDTGATLMLGQRGAISLVSPVASRDERATLIVHEMLHPRLGALIANNAALHDAVAQSACLRDAMARRTGAGRISQVYDGWNDYFAESWVRGLSHRLTHTTEPNDGFLLAHALGALGAGGHAGPALADDAAALLQQWTHALCGA